MIASKKFQVNVDLLNDIGDIPITISLPTSAAKIDEYLDHSIISVDIVKDEFARGKSLFDNRLFKGASSLKAINNICKKINRLSNSGYQVQALQIMTLGYGVAYSLASKEYNYHPVSLETFGHRVFNAVDFKLSSLSPFATDLIKISLDYKKFFQVYLESKDIVETDRGTFVSTRISKTILAFC
ncbi:MAG: hypothetical protein HRU19_02835 [Pseudobacteriovorax sp.]|nr:hypothetical protein [Pseudobacteriovorax sp.]